ncbi:MAG: flippase [Candidatus Atribacteria bacterium]
MFKKLSQLPTGKRIVKNTFSLTISNLIGQFFTVISTVYLAKVLGAGGFGRIIFAQSIIVYFGLITDFGLRTVGVREVAKNRDEIKKYISNLLALKFILATTSFILLLIFLFFINKPIDYKILIALFGLTLFPQIILLDWAFEGTEQMEFVGIARIVRPILYLLFVLLFVKKLHDLIDVPLINLGSSLAVAILLGYIFYKNYGGFKLSFNLKFWKKLIIMALPLGLSAFLLQINSNIDIIMLGFMKSDIEVGWYGAAYKIILFLIGFSGYFGIAIFPTMSRYYQESKEKLKKLIYYACKVTTFLGLPIAVGGVILAPKIITLVYGNNFQESILVFQILLGYLFLSYVMAPFFFLLQASGKMKYFLNTAIVAAITNISLNIILIPRYGIIGAAIATVISNLVIFIMLYLYSVRNIVRVSIMKDLFMAFIMALAMGVAMTLVNTNLFGKFLAGVTFYFLLFVPLEGRKWARMYKENL